jgi:hypothetical protein
LTQLAQLDQLTQLGQVTQLTQLDQLTQLNHLTGVAQLGCPDSEQVLNTLWLLQQKYVLPRSDSTNPTGPTDPTGRTRLDQLKQRRVNEFKYKTVLFRTQQYIIVRSSDHTKTINMFMELLTKTHMHIFIRISIMFKLH